MNLILFFSYKKDSINTSGTGKTSGKSLVALVNKPNSNKSTFLVKRKETVYFEAMSDVFMSPLASISEPF